MTLLTRLLGLCEHEYENIGTLEVINPRTDRIQAFRYVQECTKCHKIRTFDV